MNYYLFPIYIEKNSKTNMIKLNDYLIRYNVDNSLKMILSSLESHSKLCALNNPRYKHIIAIVVSISIEEVLIFELIFYKSRYCEFELLRNGRFKRCFGQRPQTSQRFDNESIGRAQQSLPDLCQLHARKLSQSRRKKFLQCF